MIPVTKPFLPPQAEFQYYIDGIFKRNWLTNNGPLVNELELEIKRYLDVPHFLFLNNGTIALQIAIKALGLEGEIITTPFSYVATTSSIVWENCKPVFADIDSHSLNIDPKEIEKKITANTTAILATHVYGNPCDVEAIDLIAKKNNLKVIYDGAHCFGVKFKGKSIFEFGDISTISFHSTKLYHTVEGGGVFSKNPELIKAMTFLRNFGHNGAENFEGVGINGKNSEFHAAMGLANLKYADKIINSRILQSQRYDEKLQGLRINRIQISSECYYNYSYYPIIMSSEKLLLKSIENLNAHNIFPRRYFHPILTKLPYVEFENMPIAESISQRILCLPLYYDLTNEEIDFVCRILLRTQNND